MKLSALFLFALLAELSFAGSNPFPTRRPIATKSPSPSPQAPPCKCPLTELPFVPTETQNPTCLAIPPKDKTTIKYCAWNRTTRVCELKEATLHASYDCDTPSDPVFCGKPLNPSATACGGRTKTLEFISAPAGGCKQPERISSPSPSPPLFGEPLEIEESLCDMQNESKHVFTVGCVVGPVPPPTEAPEIKLINECNSALTGSSCSIKGCEIQIKCPDGTLEKSDYRSCSNY